MLAVVTADNAGKLGKGNMNTAKLLAGPDIQHYHQAVALVVAETFEQARAAASLVKVNYAPQKGRYDLAAEKGNAVKPTGEQDPPDTKAGNFARALRRRRPSSSTPPTHTPDQSHAMMEPHASIAFWDGDKVTVWTSNQMIAWCRSDLAKTLGIAERQSARGLAVHRRRLRRRSCSCAPMRCWRRWARAQPSARSRSRCTVT